MSETRLTTIIIFSLLFLIIILICITPVQAGTETLISVNGSSQSQAPAIWGDWIVWEDDRDSDQFQIFAYNVISGEERVIRNNSVSGNAYSPRISGNTIVWQDERWGNNDIYSYNLSSGIETQRTSLLTDQSFPAINGTTIVWQDDRSGTSYDIYKLNITIGTESLVTPDTPFSNQIHPAISGDKIIWLDNRNEESSWNIFMNDTSTNQIYDLTPEDSVDEESFPAIYDSRIVWMDSDKTIIKMNETYDDPPDWPTTQIYEASGSKRKVYSPAIFGSKIVWLDNRYSGSPYTKYDVILTDLSTSTEEKINSDQSFLKLVYDSGLGTYRTGPAIYDNRVVWTDSRLSPILSIYMYTEGSTDNCPVAEFTIPSQSGPIPFTIQFDEHSTAGTKPITHWRWEFGDGNTSEEQEPEFTYNVPGTYDVRLTINNDKCRNETPVSNDYKVSVGTSPLASFTTDTDAGIVPLEVQFSDTSFAATAWNWSFGDGVYSDEQNPIHTYHTNKTFTATLNASNAYGFSHKTATITGLNGAKENADVSINGITISSDFGTQFLTLDTNTLSANTGSALFCTDEKLLSHGLLNITFLSNDGIGYTSSGTNIRGNVSSVILQTRQINLSGFSKTVGEDNSIRYTLTSPSYPEGATLNTQVWEGATTSDDSTFRYIASKSNFNSASIAYTTKITKNGFPTGITAKFNMSVNTTWANQIGEGHLYLIRIADDGNTGEVLTTRLITTDDTTGLSYYEINSTRGASTFGLALLSGSGNPFQLITLTIASQANPPAPSGDSDSYGNSGAPSGSSKGLSAQAPQGVPEQKSPVVVIDPGKTAPLYANSVGVITQETTLTSTDTLASVVLGEGTIAKDSAGNPLSSVSIASIAPDALPATPPSGQAVMIDGRAYDLGPDGATFSPGITVTFTIPQAQWGKEYSLMMYDKATGTWSEVPGSFNAKDGTFTAVLSHFCCVALFEKNIGQPAVRQTTQTPQPEPARLAPVVTPSPQPPQNAFSIVFSMAEWVSGEAVHRSSYLTAFAIICIIVLSIMLLHRRRNNP